MPKSSLFNYSEAYILLKETISVANTAAIVANANNKNKKLIFKYFASFTDFICKINNTQIDNTKDIDLVIPMYNLTEHGSNYSKTSGTLRQNDRDERTLTPADDIDDFNAANATTSLFNTKEKTGETGNNSTKGTEIVVS